MDGRSLADLATGKRASQPDGGTAFAAMIKDRSNPGGVTALVRGKWKLIETGSTHELYVHADPREQSNIASTRMQIVSELRGLLQQYVKNASRSPFE